MSAIGNFIWFILGGVLLGICWWIIGLIAYITIVGIPWGKACFVMGEFSFFPFGKEAIERVDLFQKDDIGTGGYALLGNIIWFLFAGIWLALGHALSAIICFVTIIGIPFGVQHLKLAGLALSPIGKTIVNKDIAAVARKRNAESALSLTRQQNYSLPNIKSTESDILPKESRSIGDSIILVASLAGLIMVGVLYASKPNEQITEATPADSAEAAPVEAAPAEAVFVDSAEAALSDKSLAIETLTYDASIKPNGELAEIFSFDSVHTDLQRELKLEDIKGKVIVWSLPVYDIKSTANGYKIQTDWHYKDDLFGEKLVGTFINITARNDEEKRLVESFKKGDLINIKGIISDTSLRNLNIVSAILLPADPIIADAAPADNIDEVITAQMSTQKLNMAPSFDCAKAKSRAETLICSDTELTKLDNELAVLYKQANSVAPEKAAFNETNRNEWQRREETCKERVCLLTWYADRRDQLNAVISVENLYANAAPVENFAVTQPPVADQLVTYCEEISKTVSYGLRQSFITNCLISTRASQKLILSR